jgi:hypothetical protein
MPARRWQATLLLISLVAVLFGVRAMTGGRTYAAGIVPHSLVVALQTEPQPNQAETGHQVLVAAVDTAEELSQVQRWHQRALLLLPPPVAVFLTVLVLTRPALPVIPRPTGSLTPRPAPARRRPLRPRAP